MRIIQVGNSREHQATCRCGAVIGFFRGELKCEERWTMDEFWQEYQRKVFYLNCPCCGKEIVVDI